MQSYRHWKLLLGITLALSAVDVTAQDQGRAHASRMSGESPNDPTYLLAAESVQKELALTNDQITSLEKIREEEHTNHPFRRGFAGKSQGDIQKLLDKHAQSTRERVTKVLTAKQLARLNEINLQVVGINALTFDEVAQRLKLTPEQRAKLKQLGDQSRRQMTHLHETNRSRSGSAAQKEYKQKVDAATAERKEQFTAVLTDDQRMKFEQLQGSKFDTSQIQSNRKSFTSRGHIEAPVKPAPQKPASI